MNMKFFKYLPIFFTSLLGLNSCISTEEVKSETPEEKNVSLTLNLTTPAEHFTRATSDYKLRYIAKIMKGSTINSWGDPITTKEIIDGETDKNTIIFQVPPGYDYTIMVFADYIPKEYTADSNGHYKDYFYNTTQYAKRCVMRTTPGTDSETVSADFFNNDSYDCFFNLSTIHKDEPEVTVNMTLKRVVAKVTFLERSENLGECNVAINKLGNRKNFDWETQASTDPSDPNKDLKGIALNQTSNISDSNKDLFYFYTFANKDNIKNASIGFTVSREGKKPVEKSVTEIPVKANYKTIVKGEFLPTESTEEEPKEEDTPKIGDIILNLTYDNSWEMESLGE